MQTGGDAEYENSNERVCGIKRIKENGAVGNQGERGEESVCKCERNSESRREEDLLSFLPSMEDIFFKNQDESVKLQ